jgi:hypothetical protein
MKNMEVVEDRLYRIRMLDAKGNCYKTKFYQSRKTFDRAVTSEKESARVWNSNYKTYDAASSPVNWTDEH